METLKIEATKYSPSVELSSEGEMIISGRSIIEDPVTFYGQIIGWIRNCKSKKFTLELRLEYMNTSSSKLILNLLKSISDKYNTNDIYINWFYDSDDEDMLDLGRDFESLICVPIDFHEMCVEEV